MAEKEQNIPSLSAQTLAPGSEVCLTDGTHSLAVRKDGVTNALQLQVSRSDQVIFSVAIGQDSTVHLVFMPVLPPPPLASETTVHPIPETAKPPEYPAITIEGVPIRGAKYNQEKRTYSLTIAHHPNPENRKEAVYYDIVAEGDKAEELYKAYVTDSRTPVRVTGEDHSTTITRKDKPDKRVNKVHADSIEKIKGRRDSPDILPEKARLADLSQQR